MPFPLEPHQPKILAPLHIPEGKFEGQSTYASEYTGKISATKVGVNWDDEIKLSRLCCYSLIRQKAHKVPIITKPMKI